MVPSSREPKETPAAAIKTLSRCYHCHFYTKHAFFIVLRQDLYFNVYTSFVDTGNPSSLVPIASIVLSSEFVWSNKKNHFEWSDSNFNTRFLNVQISAVQISAVQISAVRISGIRINEVQRIIDVRVLIMDQKASAKSCYLTLQL